VVLDDADSATFVTGLLLRWTAPRVFDACFTWVARRAALTDFFGATFGAGACVDTRLAATTFAERFDGRETFLVCCLRAAATGALETARAVALPGGLMLTPR
jgi:hypothetical protein